MTVSEKVSYLKGLASGLNLDENDKNSKVITAIIDVLEDIALDLGDVQDDIVELNDYIEEIDEDLENVEDYLEEECELDDCCSCDDDDDDYYCIVCPTCGEEFYIDDDVAYEGEIKCPNCGEDLEFDLNDLESDCDCDDCCDHEEK